jgi:hypothetical protein
LATVQARGTDRVPKASVVPVDECHIMHAVTGTLVKHPEWQDIPVIGFTATPGRCGLGSWYDDLVIGSTT